MNNDVVDEAVPLIIDDNLYIATIIDWFLFTTIMTMHKAIM